MFYYIICLCKRKLAVHSLTTNVKEARMRVDRFIAFLFPFAILAYVISTKVLPFLYVAWCIDFTDHMVSNALEIKLERAEIERKSTPIIPRILHQIWKNESIPVKWAESAHSCTELYSDFQVMLWTDSRGRELIASDFSWFLSTYDSYPYDIQRVDVLRYFVLYKFGGIYMDLDVGCRNSRSRIDTLMQFPFVVAKTAPVGFSNDVIFSAQNHELLRLMTRQLKRWNHIYGTKFLTVFISTGPIFYSYHIGKFVSEKRVQDPLEEYMNPQTGLYVLDNSLYGNENKDWSYFFHLQGSSWHGWDAKLLSTIYEHKRFAFLICVFGVLIICRGLCRNKPKVVKILPRHKRYAPSAV